MAIGHPDLSNVCRSAGRNACNAGSYITSGDLYDPRTQQRFNYKRKRGTLHSEIVLPDCVAAPLDSQTLWATAELSEARKDAVVARQFILALPHEISAGARIELTRAFSKFVAEEHGVAVEFAIHAPPRDGDQRNFHAHVLFTSRRAKFIDGIFALGEKTRELDVKSTSSECVKKFRGQWEKLVNDSLSAAGSEARIDLRSHLDRAEERGGLVLAPAKHLGPAAAAAKRRDRRPRAQRVNEEILRARSDLIEVNRALKNELQSLPAAAASHRRPPTPRAGNRHGPRP